MEDQAPNADIDTLRFIQSKLDSRDEEEAAFIRGLQGFIDEKLEKEGKHKKQRKEDQSSYRSKRRR